MCLLQTNIIDLAETHMSIPILELKYPRFDEVTEEIIKEVEPIWLHHGVTLSCPIGRHMPVSMGGLDTPDMKSPKSASSTWLCGNAIFKQRIKSAA